MEQKFINNNSNNLVIFLMGWGMDETPLKPLKSKSDILYLWDYSGLDFSFDFLKYSNIDLITFSCGVYIAGIIKDKLPPLNQKVAVNGTLNLFDEKTGLSKATSEKFLSINKNNFMEFREKMLVRNKKELQKFNKFQPKRTLESAIKEFEALKRYSNTYKNVSFEYDKILIAKEDKILPPELQKAFWKEKYKIIEGAHFPFFNFESIEEIIQH